MQTLESMTTRSPAAEALKALRNRAGLTVRAMAEALGRPASTYASYEDKYKKPYLPLDLIEDLSPILEARGIPRGEILELAGLKEWDSAKVRLPSEPERADADLAAGYLEVGGRDWVSIARYDAAVSAGPGAIIDQNADPIGYQMFEAQWLRAITRAQPHDLAVVRVDGDSMDQTLRDGDWVLVDRSQRRLNREGVYALAVDDACWVKRITLNLRDKLVQVVSDNPTYPLQELSEEDLTVLGRVVWIVGRKV